MGERGTDLSANDGAPHAVPADEDQHGNSGADHESDPRAIEHEIVAIRSELGDLVSELDRRRREALDVKVQAQRHPIAVSMIGVAGAVVVAGLVTWAYRQLRSDPPLTRARKLADALAIVARDPDKLINALEDHPDPRAALWSTLLKIAAAAGQRAVSRAL